MNDLPNRSRQQRRNEVLSLMRRALDSRACLLRWNEGQTPEGGFSEFTGRIDASPLGAGTLELQIAADGRILVPGLPVPWTFVGFERHDFNPRRFEPLQIALPSATPQRWIPPLGLAASSGNDEDSIRPRASKPRQPAGDSAKEYVRVPMSISNASFLVEIRLLPINSTRSSADQLELTVYARDDIGEPLVAIAETSRGDARLVVFTDRAEPSDWITEHFASPSARPGEQLAKAVVLFDWRASPPLDSVTIRPAYALDLTNVALPEADRIDLARLATNITPCPVPASDQRLSTSAAGGAVANFVRFERRLAVDLSMESTQFSERVNKVISGAMEHYSEKLLGLAKRCLGDRHIAEDVVQDTAFEYYRWLRFRMVVASSQDSAEVSGMLYEILRRRVYRIRRKVNLCRESAVAPAEFSAGAQDQIAAEDREYLAQILSMLELDEAMPIFEHYLNGLGYEEIACLHGPSAGTMKVRNHRSIKKLRELVAANPLDHTPLAERLREQFARELSERDAPRAPRQFDTPSAPGVFRAP